MRDADRAIRGRMSSYAVLQEVGEWLKETTAPDARIMSQSVAQLTYYSERAGVQLAPSREAALSFLQASKMHYLVLSDYELKPDWLLRFAPRGAGFQVLTVFQGADAEAEVLRANTTDRAIR
jgi:hypothetical protein